MYHRNSLREVQLLVFLRERSGEEKEAGGTKALWLVMSEGRLREGKERHSNDVVVVYEAMPLSSS